MAKPLYLAIPSGGMKEYEKFERLFSFYPEGIDGVIKEYLNSYANPEFLLSLLTDDIDTPGLSKLEEPKQIIADKVIKAYEASDDYRAKLHVYPNCQDELLIEIVCEEISQKTWELVEQHVDVFSKYQCEFTKMKWMGDTMILKAKKFVSLSWFYS